MVEINDYNRSGIEAYQKGDIIGAFESFSEGFERLEGRLDSKAALSLAKNYIAILGVSGDTALFMSRAKQILESLPLASCEETYHSLNISTLNNIVANYLRLNLYPRALEVYDSSVDYVNRCGLDSVNLVQISANLLQLALINDDFQRATGLFNFIETYEDKVFGLDTKTMSVLKAMQFLEREEIDSALVKLTMAIEESILEEDNEFLKSCLHFGRHVVVPRLEGPLAIEWIRKLESLSKNQISSDYSDLLIGKIQLLGEKESDIIVLEKHNDTLNYIIGALIVALLLMLVVFLRYRLYHQRILHAKEIEHQSIVSNQESNLKELKLEFELLKDRQKRSTALHKLRLHPSKKPKNRKELKLMVLRVIPDFDAKMNALATAQLSENDKCILMTIALGLSAEDAADVLSIEQSSYLSTRSRMSKTRFNMSVKKLTSIVQHL